MEEGMYPFENKTTYDRPALEAMNRLEIRQAPFSKIGTCYTLHIARDLKNTLKRESQRNRKEE